MTDRQTDIHTHLRDPILVFLVLFETRTNSANHMIFCIGIFLSDCTFIKQTFCLLGKHTQNKIEKQNRSSENQTKPN